MCREAALGPIRAITDIQNIDASEVSILFYFDTNNVMKTSLYGRSMDFDTTFKTTSHRLCFKVLWGFKNRKKIILIREILCLREKV